MDAFSHLSVLLSIILGLAITQILKGYRGLMQSRARLRLYGPAVLWSVLLLLIDVQAWWAMFGLRNLEQWTFVAFSIVLLQTVVLYLLAALVLPDFFGDELIDLRAYYYANHRWFFTLAVLAGVVSVLKDLVISGHWPHPLNLVSHAVFTLLCAIGALSARETYHRLLAPLITLAFCLYVAVLFARLD